MHLCPLCGAVPPRPRSGAGGPLLLAAGSGDDSAADLAIADLTRQAKSAPPELARLLRLIRDRIALQEKAAGLVERGLRRTYRALVEALREALGGARGATVAARAQSLALNLATLGSLLVAAGLDDLQAEVAAAQEDLVGLATDTVEAGGLRREVSATAIRAAVSTFQQGFWDARIIQPSAERLFDGLRSSITGESLDDAVDRLAKSLEVSIPQAVTEARTRIAEFDRAVTAQSAAEAGAKHFIYLGPVDGITRPFCAELVGHVFTDEQIAQMDNGQVATSPLFSGGGFNCRHQFSPADPALVEALGWPMGTDAMVRRANERAAR